MDFGTSIHISKIILTALGFDHTSRAALNVRFSEEIVERFKHHGLSVSEFDRSEEPEGVSTMEWGTERAILDLGRIPDVVFDRGSIGKEPMVRVLGKSPSDLLTKLKLVLAE